MGKDRGSNVVILPLSGRALRSAPAKSCQFVVMPHVPRQFFHDGALTVKVAPLPGGGFIVEAIDANVEPGSK